MSNTKIPPSVVKDIELKSEFKRFVNSISKNKKWTIPEVLENILERTVKQRLEEYPIDNFAPNELGQAEAAVYYLQGFIKYCSEWGWMYYDAEEDAYRADCGEMILMETLKYLGVERQKAHTPKDPTEKKPKGATAKYLEKVITASDRKNVAQTMKTDPSIFCRPEEFDADPYLLNCKGTTVNLKTGELEPSLPAHMHTKSAGYSLPDMLDNKPPKNFFKFLSEITCGDNDMVNWLLRWFGYCLTGDVSAAYFVNFYGFGGNGKGVLLRLMQKIMGSYATVLSPRAIVLQGRETSGRFELANLQGARLAIIDDVPDGKFDEVTIKQLTGEGSIRAEQKFKNAFEFTPIAKLALASNTKLGMRDTGNSMKRRLRAVPFNYTPPQDKIDPRLEEKLLEEAPYILALAIAQAKIYLANPGPAGFPLCAAIDETSKEYIESQNTVAQFLEEKTEKVAEDVADAGISAKEVYNAYKDWCTENSCKPLAVTRFGENIKRNGITKIHRKKGNWYTGIALCKR
jgi:putative DNA primase/helicase